MRIETIGDATPWVRIYALCEYPDTPRYVGKTIRYMHERHKQHIANACGKRQSQLPVARWIRKQVAGNKPLIIMLLENVAVGKEWQQRERYWIQKLRADGADLLNLTDGGEGLPGHKFTPEHKAKISSARKTGKQLSCEVCATSIWRSLSEIAKGDCRFCSKQCYALSQKGKSKTISHLCVDRGIAAAAAQKRARTHCRNGHEFSKTNTYINKHGARICRTCTNISKRKYRDRGGRG